MKTKTLTFLLLFGFTMLPLVKAQEANLKATFKHYIDMDNPEDNVTELVFIEESFNLVPNQNFILAVRVNTNQDEAIIKEILDGLEIWWLNKNNIGAGFQEFTSSNIKISTKEIDGGSTIYFFELDGFPKHDVAKIDVSIGELGWIFPFKVAEDSEVNKTPLTGKWVYQPFSSFPENIANLECEYDEIGKENISEFGEEDLVYLYDFGAIGNRLWKIERKEIKAKNDDKFILVKTPLNLNNTELKRRNNLRIKIINVNQYLYDVEINDSLINYTGQMPILFRELFYPDSSKIAIGIINSLSTSLSSSGISPVATKPREDESVDLSSLENVFQALRDFYISYNKLNTITIQAYNRCGSFACCSKLTEDRVGYYYYDLSMRLMHIKSLIYEMEGELGDKLKLLTFNQKKIEDNNKLLVKIKKIKTDITAKQSEIDAIKEENEKKKKLKEEKEAFEKSLKKYQNDTMPQTKLDLITAAIKGAKRTLTYHTTLINILEKLPKEEELRAKQIFVNNMTIRNSYVQLDHIPLNGDELELSIKVTPKENMSTIGIYDNAKFTANIPISGHTTFSFSQGAFVGFGTGDLSLQNKKYSWRAVPTSGNVVSANPTEYRLVESGYSDIPAGFNAFGNIHFWNRRSFKLGLSAGPGITIEREPRVAYLAGFSGAWTNQRDKQVVLTIGAVGMNVERLNNDWLTVESEGTKYATTPNLDYHNEFKVGMFVSITYTFFKDVKWFSGKNKAQQSNNSSSAGDNNEKPEK